MTTDRTGRQRALAGLRSVQIEFTASDAAAAGVTPDDLVGLWREHVQANHGHQVRVSGADPTRFHGETHVRRLSDFRLGGLQAIRFKSGPVSYERGGRAAERDEDDAVRLVVPRTGTIRLEQGDDREIVRPGQVGLVSWLEHVAFKQAEEDTDAVIVNVPAAALPPALRYRPPMLLDPHRVITRSLIGMVHSLTAHSGPMSPADFLFMNDEIFRILNRLLDDRQAAELDQWANLVADARALVDTMFWDPALSVDTLAEHMNVPRRKLEYAFETVGGKPDSETVPGPGALIRETRLARAYQQLEAADRRSVADIAAACGFGSLNTFHTAFKAQYQATPAQVRRAAAQREQTRPTTN